MSFIGGFGSLFLAICSIPQALDSVRNGHSNGVSPYMLWLWFTGSFLMLIYNYFSYYDAVLCVNNICSMLFSGIITYYKYFPRPA